MIRRVLAELDAALLNQNVREALRGIRRAENNPDSAKDRDDRALYSSAFGGKPIADPSQNPGKRPAGVRQFEPGTRKAAKDAPGLRDFSARSQDLAAVWLINGRQQSENVMAGKVLTAALNPPAHVRGALRQGPQGGSPLVGQNQRHSKGSRHTMTTSGIRATSMVLAMLGCCSVVLAQTPSRDPYCDFEAAADVDASLNPTERGVAELVRASAGGNAEVVQRLLKAGVDPNRCEELELTPLAWAARCGRLDTVKALVHGGADVNRRFEFASDGHALIHDSTAIMWAARGGWVEVVEYLLAAGADLGQHETVYRALDGGTREQYDGPGSDVLYGAHDPRVVELLLAAGAPPDALRPRTRLMDAAAGGEAEVCRLLLKYGADKRLKDADGLTAYELAKKYQPDNADLQALLK